MLSALFVTSPHPPILWPCLIPEGLTYALLLTVHLPSSPGLDRLPLPVSGFPRASRKTQHQ